jgi:hypothetical protein
VGHCLSQGDNMSLLKHTVDGNKGFERLDFVGENGLDLDTSPERLGRFVIPCVYNACAHMLALRGDLVVAGSFLDIDRKLLVGFGMLHTT